MQTTLNNECLFERILYDPSQQPVVMATVPNLVGLLSDGGGPLFILPQGVKLWGGEKEVREVRTGRSKTEDQGRGRRTCAPVKPPSAMLNMNLCLVAFFFSSLMLTADAAVPPPSLGFSPFWSCPDSSVFIPSFSSFCSEEEGKWSFWILGRNYISWLKKSLKVTCTCSVQLISEVAVEQRYDCLLGTRKTDLTPHH